MTSRPFLVTSSTFSTAAALPVVECPPPSPLDWLLSPKGDTLAERILAQLIQSEAHERDPHLRDDYRQTFIALSLALKENHEQVSQCWRHESRTDLQLQAASRLQNGMSLQTRGSGYVGSSNDKTASHELPIYFIEASYLMYGLHPEKVYPAILARRASLLGPNGADATHSLESAPKKSVQSVKSSERKSA